MPRRRIFNIGTAASAAPPDLEFIYDVTADISGAAATITDVTAEGFGFVCDPVGATHVYCYSLASGDLNVTVTFTVLPTAAGTVTADTVVTGDFNTYSASESTTGGNGEDYIDGGDTTASC